MARLTALIRIGPLDWCAAGLAWLALGVSALAIRLVPLRRMAPLLGHSIGAVAYAPLLESRQTARALRLRLAIARAARLMPLRSDCYPQALAGVLLCRLGRVPVAMHLGVRLDAQGNPHAHAWLASGPVLVSGGAGHARFVPVACFVSRYHL